MSSHEGTKTRRNREELSRMVVDCAYSDAIVVESEGA
jgi:hypothetical protein